MPEPSNKETSATETVTRTLLVAFLVSLVCSSFVASAAVLLKPRQVANALIDMRRNILDVAGLLGPEGDVNERYEQIEQRVVDLKTGAYIETVDADRSSEHGIVYLVRADEELRRIILPVSGPGLWSTLYGFIALEPDADTIADITFYAHAETPGLGDFISRPEWRAIWRGKRAFDDSGKLRIQVIKGQVPTDDPLADYHVDGVSGATLTGTGVSELVRHWLGDDGYGPYLLRIRQGDRP